MKTLGELKVYPKLYKAIQEQAEFSGYKMKDHHRIEMAIDSLWWDSGPHPYGDFWSWLSDREIDKAREIKPDLFEQPQVEFVVGRKYMPERNGIHGAEIEALARAFAKSFAEVAEKEEKQDYKHIEYGFAAGKGFYTKVVDDEQEEVWKPKVITEEFKQGMQKVRDKFHAQKAERLNAAMLERDGPEEVCNTQELWDKPKHSEVKSLFEDTFPITKFDPRGM